jgi:ribosomal-protein-alanine N-acetyltransferase
MPRRATQSDTGVMAAVHATAFTGQDIWSRDVFSLQLELPGVFGFVHQGRGMILARVALDEAEILTLAVAPAARRTGIGRLLLQAAARTAAEAGASAMFLEVSVKNPPAIELYTTSGFKQAGRRPNYYSDSSDALVMRLDLEPPSKD